MNKKERLRFIDKIIRIQSYNLQGKNIKHEIENLRKQQTSPLNNMTSNSISNLSTANRQSTSNINIDKIEISTQATDVDSISNQIGASLENQLKRTTATFEDGIEA